MFSSIRFIVRLVAAISALLVGAIAGWLAYSRFVVDRQADLPKALDAERTEFDSAVVGRLSFYADRSGAGRPLVLIHSINAAPSALEMKPLFEHYRGQRPVFALELPGFGFSERSDRRYSPQLYANAINEFLEREMEQAADVVAFSLSSEFAARAALTAPERVHSLAFISPTGLGGSSGPSTETGDGIYDFVTKPLWSQALYDLLTSRASIRYFLNLIFVEEAPESLVDYGYATSHQPGARHAPFYFISGRLFTPDAQATLYEPLPVPTLILYDRDPNVSFDRLPQLIHNNSRVQAAHIAPTQGMLQWEKPAETAAALDEFWAD